MDKVEVVAYKRSDFSGRYLKKMRRDGNVPGVIYGNGKGTSSFFVPASLIQKVVYADEPKLIDFNLQGEKHECIVKEVQIHPVNEMLIHVDLYEVNPKKEVEMNVLIEPVGIASGVKQGGILIQKIKILKIKALVNNMPKKVYVDITKLEEGQTYRVGDINKDGDFTIVENPKTPIFSIKQTKK